MELRNSINKNMVEKKPKALTKLCLGFKYTMGYIIH